MQEKENRTFFWNSAHGGPKSKATLIADFFKKSRLIYMTFGSVQTYVNK